MYSTFMVPPTLLQTLLIYDLTVLKIRRQSSSFLALNALCLSLSSFFGVDDCFTYVTFVSNPLKL